MVSTHVDRGIHGHLRLHPGRANRHARYSPVGRRSRRGPAYPYQRRNPGSCTDPYICPDSITRSHGHPGSHASANFNPHPRAGTNPNSQPGPDVATPGIATGGGIRTPTYSPNAHLDSYRHIVDITFGPASQEPGFSGSIRGDFQAPDRFTCSEQFGFGGLTFPGDKVVVIGTEAWIDTGDGWHTATIDDPKILDVVDSCAAWPLFWEDFDVATFAEVEGQPDELNGVPAVRYDLKEVFDVLDALPLPITGSEELSLIEEFTVWAAQKDKWMLALALGFSGDADEFAEFMESDMFEASEGEQFRMTFSAEIFDLNNPDIRVRPPSP